MTEATDMDAETETKLIATIRSVRLQLHAIERDLDAIERAITGDVPGDG